MRAQHVPRCQPFLFLSLFTEVFGRGLFSEVRGGICNRGLPRGAFPLGLFLPGATTRRLPAFNLVSKSGYTAVRQLRGSMPLYLSCTGESSRTEGVDGEHKRELGKA